MGTCRTVHSLKMIYWQIAEILTFHAAKVLLFFLNCANNLVKKMQIGVFMRELNIRNVSGREKMMQKTELFGKFERKRKETESEGAKM